MRDLQTIMLTKTQTIADALQRLDATSLGILLLVDAQSRFLRTVTDGDLRRLLIAGKTVKDDLSILPQAQSLTFKKPYTKAEALRAMNSHVIRHIPVLDDQGMVIELLDRHDIDEPILLSTPHMGSYELDYVTEAFTSNWIAPLGPNVDAFETELAAKTESGFAAALSSGTAALHLALRLLNVGRGDRVFCSSLTFVASVNPVLYQGAEPVFIDSEAQSWNMSPQALERAFAKAKAENTLPKAVIIVNLYGQSADMEPLMALCEAYGVAIIEDAAESLGARYKDKSSGTFGVMGIYSFNGNKIITTSGGGALVSNDEDLIKRARFLATQAREPALHYQHDEMGYNYRMSNILAGVGRGQLKVLDHRVEARRYVFSRYQDLLRDCDDIDWMPEPDWSYATHWLSAAMIKPRNPYHNAQSLITHLSDQLIEARPIWKPMHLQPLFKDCAYFAHSDDASISDHLYENGLCLPSGSNMSDKQIIAVAEAIQDFISQKG
jgi:dTDP-4-amino-4,6-dideoxygalactose transaminase